VSAGYFIATACSANLNLVSNIDGALLYSLVKVALPLVNVIRLNRFVFATIQF